MQTNVVEVSTCDHDNDHLLTRNKAEGEKEKRGGRKKVRKKGRIKEKKEGTEGLWVKGKKGGRGYKEG